MKRYCTNCQKEYEFAPVAITGKEDLICPDCGNVIDKNSRLPVDHSATRRFEEQIGNFFATIMGLAYVFYITLAIIGLVGYFLHQNMVLYVATGIALVAYIIQLLTNSSTFRWGMLFLPLGAAAGFYFLGGINGACFGVLAVFFIRHVIRDVFFAVVRWLIRLGNR